VMSCVDAGGAGVGNWIEHVKFCEGGLRIGFCGAVIVALAEDAALAVAHDVCFYISGDGASAVHGAGPDDVVLPVKAMPGNGSTSMPGTEVCEVPSGPRWSWGTDCACEEERPMKRVGCQ
jgi:hypothetical protein